MGILKMKLPIVLSRFSSDESGTGTVFSIFAIAMLIIIGGIAVDGSNFWRNEQMLQKTADAAAHAGAVQFAYGNDSMDARDSAGAIVNSNMPSEHYGNLYADQSTDIEALHYDAATNSLNSTGTPNAVRVYLHRDQLSDNPVRTFALRLSDLFLITEQTNLSSWNMQVRGVAALTKFQGCNSTDGIYAKDQIRLSSSNTIGGGYCLHSQSEVWMSQQNTFEPNSGLSMPNLDACGSKCTDSANPGSTAASFARNLIMPDIATHIQTVQSSFLGSGSAELKDEFFFGKFIESSQLYVLSDIGITTSGLSTGSVVNISQNEFESLPHIPEGLTYDVACTANGNGPNTSLDFEFGSGSGTINNIAIMTNCGLDFGTGTDVTSSVILSTRQASSATITASSGASIGDPAGGCDVDDKSSIMGMGDMHVPADFAGSNISFVVDGDIHLSAASSSGTISHSGVSFHSSGEIDIAAGHTFDACAVPPSGLVPSLRVIRQVIPT